MTFKYGTIAFEGDFMSKSIGFGEPIIDRGEFKGFDFKANPNKLDLSVWMAFVPPAFQSVARQACGKLEAFRGEVVGQQTKEMVIHVLLSEIDKLYKSTRPRDWGRM